MITLNYCYRIYPNTTQQQTLVEWMEICRSAFNYALREIKDWCDSRKCPTDRCSIEKEYILAADLKFPTVVNQLNSLPKAKKEFPRLGEVPSQVLQQAIKQLHRGWEYFQERGFGFPRFKKYGKFKSLLFPQFKHNPVTNVNLSLPKIGAISINLQRPIPDGFVVKQVRIIRKADRWYASINLQLDVKVPDPIALLHLKVARCRKEFHYSVAHWLCQTYDLISFENLNIRGLARTRLAKSILDCAWGAFLQILQAVAVKRGKQTVEVSARGSSIECSGCGARVEKTLKDRVHECPSCQLSIDRDWNSALVLLDRGLRTVGLPFSGCGGQEVTHPVRQQFSVVKLEALA
ncbi:MAG: IS200/IS605 family transposase ISSoc12 [Chroococcidiopsis cubana SAG 39.79]|uniref:Transposase n=1 Tax=Chroococcidiopsis cubana SAG 39.79 TaxID=388085 RepID=A0AB37U8J6_9CYAN|nr:zinc ribbon domain-containing protein [Chroococcidiopsis cubana]MDZ4877494.1 IS200/IS605 family transposase ISSoc12 [Chroococcidiopsis cubana SAG 39.79]RUS95926.1 hypothetical protein DSM107010_70930 [Chroococcidiopsis cubana SAG 39.79]